MPVTVMPSSLPACCQRWHFCHPEPLQRLEDAEDTCHERIASPMMFRKGLCQAFPSACNVDGCCRGPRNIPVFPVAECPRFVGLLVGPQSAGGSVSGTSSWWCFLLMPRAHLPPLTGIILCPEGAGTVSACLLSTSVEHRPTPPLCGVVCLSLLPWGCARSGRGFLG